MVSFLFRPRFENILDLLMLLSSSTRGSKLIFNGDLFTLLDLHLKASQIWFWSGLTLESQSNLQLKFCYVSTYLDLTLPASLVALWFCRTYLLDWTYNSDTKSGWDLKFFKNSDLFELFFFLSEGLSEDFIGCKTPIFFTLHSCFRQENIYLMQGAMQCMIVHE